MWDDIAKRYTPVERSDQRWRGQTVTLAYTLSLGAAGGPAPTRNTRIATRTERIQLIIVNQQNLPVWIRNTQTGNDWEGIYLPKAGSLLDTHVLDDGELTIGDWFLYATSVFNQSVFVTEVIRDVQMDYSE